MTLQIALNKLKKKRKHCYFSFGPSIPSEWNPEYCKWRERDLIPELKYREIDPKDDLKLAEIIRSNLKEAKLDIPGTVYFDENLNRLSEYYLDKAYKRYYLIATLKGEVVGGIGLAEFDGFENTAELQKLYLSDSVKGHGFGYELIRMIEEKALEFGYKKIYLETHTNLDAAIHMYEKCGYTEIEKPESVVHSTMNRFYIKDL